MLKQVYQFISYMFLCFSDVAKNKCDLEPNPQIIPDMSHW